MSYQNSSRARVDDAREHREASDAVPPLRPGHHEGGRSARGSKPSLVLRHDEAWQDLAAQARGDLVARAVEHAIIDGEIDADVLADDPFLQLTPYFETMGPTATPGEHKEFWWEREWRMVGDYHLGHPRRWVAVLAPEDDHEALRAELEERDIDAVWAKRPMLDPSWGLERMIAHLAKVNEDYIGPFTER